MSSRSMPKVSVSVRERRRSEMLSPFTVGIVETRTSIAPATVVRLMRPSCGRRRSAMSMWAITFRREMMALWSTRSCGGHGDFVEDAVDAVADAEIVFERLDVDVRRALGDGFADDLVDELDHAGLGIVVRDVERGVLLDALEGAVVLEDFLEDIRADAVQPCGARGGAGCAG